MASTIEPQDTPLVLIADDDATTRILIRHTLQKSGFRTVELEDGLEVTKVFQDRQPDIILLDVMMPEMNGFDVCAALRALPTGQHVPILIVTGLDDITSINQAYEVGATDFITKPITFPLLEHRLRYALRASQIAEQLGKSQTRLANAQEIAKLGNWEWNLTTRAIKWSDEVFQIFGYAPQSLEPTEELLLGLVHPDDRELYRETIVESITEDRSRRLDLRIIRPDGTERILNQQWEIITAETGEMMLQGIVQDITERKQVENELREYRLRLEERVEQRTAELQAAKEQAEQANELKDKFVSLVAHDLRSPLSGMISALEYMHTDDETPLNEEHEEIVNRLIDISKSSVNMINEVLNISRLKTGKIVPRLEVVNTRGAVKKAIDTLVYLARQKGVELVNQVDEENQCFADPVLFSEVLQNLTSNAIKFCHKGDIVQFFIAEDGITLGVKDSGIGIDSDIKSRLFNIEEKTSRPGTSGEPGTGFGLPFSYDIMQAHQGLLWVESTPDEGATFFLQFPSQ